MNDEIRQRWQEVAARVADAARRAGRDPGDVRIVAVSKTVGPDRVKAAVDAGVTLLGENYIQEAEDKIAALGGIASWHFIGKLQTNKAKFAARLFDMIHSVDNDKLAETLSRRAELEGRVIDALVQVNVAAEETKSGTTPEDAGRLADYVRTLPGLRLRGLMTMPPFFDQPERARPFFAELRRLRERICPDCPELSMGMSGDYEAAIAEGATLVRIGTAIFGARG